ncbi:MAG TPA: tRNA pseudouridine(55) synthase TruB [Candidatus Limnocylindrales bacterium]|nr:tRNA pseudouridine(55) synthase TruB [Candidatus Limnocylindrales bacterium]
MQGLLLIDKPKGWTSFDVVNYVRRIVASVEGKKPKNCKVGHIGTLDPLATGLLVLLVGKEYTRRATELSKLDKTYDVVMKLGETSTTADAEGELTFVSDRKPDQAEVAEALQRFVGDIMQTPPIYSAMKVNGVRAYKLARAGEVVALEARPARINSIEMTEYAYPFVRFTADVGSGTYIRSLVEDVGRELATGAYMSDLKRTRIGTFSLSDALDGPQSLSGDTLLTSLRQLP